jgi:FAD:protein FMN transferase
LAPFPLLLAVVLAAGLLQSSQRFEAVEPHMGTLVRITLYAPGEPQAAAAFRAAFARIEQLDRILSDYRPDSELNQVATTAVGRAVHVGDDLCTVLSASQDLAYRTDGAFDVTQGPVVRLWREARKTGHVPDAAAIREAETRSGYRKLHVDARRRTVMLDTPGMALDVGAIGKGYAASEALEALRRAGIKSALVAVSGDLAFSDAPPGLRGWRVAIHAEDPSMVHVPRVLELTNAAVSTAGSSEQHLDADGRRYSHIIDPSTGMGLASDITVTVIARHGLEADGLDTAASVLGVARGLRLIESRRGVAALFIEHTKGGRDTTATEQPAAAPSTNTTVHLSARFRQLVARHKRD